MKKSKVVSVNLTIESIKVEVNQTTIHGANIEEIKIQLEQVLFDAISNAELIIK